MKAYPYKFTEGSSPLCGVEWWCPGPGCVLLAWLICLGLRWVPRFAHSPPATARGPMALALRPVYNLSFFHYIWYRCAMPVVQRAQVQRRQRLILAAKAFRRYVVPVQNYAGVERSVIDKAFAVRHVSIMIIETCDLVAATPLEKLATSVDDPNFSSCSNQLEQQMREQRMEIKKGIGDSITLKLQLAALLRCGGASADHCGACKHLDTEPRMGGGHGAEQ
jgi:hypothetical protein